MTINVLHKYLDNPVFLLPQHADSIAHIADKIEWSKVSLDELTRVNYKIREIVRTNVGKLGNLVFQALSHVANDLVYPECLKKLRERKDPVKDCKFYLGKLKDAVLELKNDSKSSAAKNRAVQAAAKEMTTFLRSNQLDFTLSSIPELHEFNQSIIRIKEKHESVTKQGGYNRYFISSETQKVMDIAVGMLKPLESRILEALGSKTEAADLIKDLQDDSTHLIDVRVLNRRILDVEHAVQVCCFLAKQNPDLLYDYLSQARFHFSAAQLDQIKQLLHPNQLVQRFNQLFHSLIEKNRAQVQQDMIDRQVKGKILYGMNFEIDFGNAQVHINKHMETELENGDINTQARFLQAAANIDYIKKNEQWNYTEIGREILKNYERYPIIAAKGRKLLGINPSTYVEKICHIYGKEAVKLVHHLKAVPSSEDYLSQLNLTQEEMKLAFPNAMNKQQAISQAINEMERIGELCQLHQRKQEVQPLQVPASIQTHHKLKKPVATSGKMPIKKLEEALTKIQDASPCTVQLFSDTDDSRTFYISPQEGILSDVALIDANTKERVTLQINNKNKFAEGVRAFVREYYPSYKFFKIIAY